MAHLSNVGDKSAVFEKGEFGKTLPIQRLAILLVVFILLAAIYHFHYLLFHSIVEILSVVVSGAIFMFGWNSRKFIATSYFTILGVGYLAVSILDFLHAFTYPGMKVWPGLRPDVSIQLWIAARFIESLFLFHAQVLVHRKINGNLLLSISMGMVFLFVAAILIWPVMPTCYVPGKGLTHFTIVSEYVIIFILLVSVKIMHINRSAFDTDIWKLLISAIWVTIFSEFVFTLKDTYGFLNLVGHFLKFISIYLIYMAIVESGLMRPYRAVINTLKQKEAVEKETSRRLLESEAKFDLLVDKIEGIFWIATANMKRILYISSGFEKITQRCCAEVYGNPKVIVDILHFEDRKRVMDTIVLNPKNGCETEFRIIRPDGKIRWINYQGYPVKNEHGAFVQVCGMAYDITKKKRLEQRLVQAGQLLEQRVAARTKALSVAIGSLKKQVREKSKIGKELKERNIMLKTLVQAMPDMVTYKDLQGWYLISNSAHRAFFGLKGKSVIGKTNADFKIDNMVKERTNKDHIVIKKRGKAMRFESILHSNSGSASHWDIRKIPEKDVRGKIVGILSLSRDISPFKQRELQLQQSEAMLQALLDGISEPMFMLDSCLNVIYLNRAAATTYSIDMHGKDVLTCAYILCEEKGPCETCTVQTVMSHKKAVSFDRRCADSHRVEKVSLYPLSKKKNGLDGVVVRIADITEAKGLERHLIHSEKMNALGLLAAGMVHEINNPNSFISFNLPILRAYLDKIFVFVDSHPAAVENRDWFGMDYPEFRREIFSLIDNLSHGSSRIDNIVSNLKSITHPKQISRQRKWVDLFGVLDKAIILCRSEIRKRVKVLEVLPSKSPIRLKTDPEALEQVIINLLINASHAADKTDSWIRIQAYPSEDLLNHSIIEVRDNGCGMATETMARIFDPFFTTKRPGLGTGLGLSVSYDLIRQLGGEILVDSKPDEGALFKIVLPTETGVEEEYELYCNNNFEKIEIVQHKYPV